MSDLCTLFDKLHGAVTGPSITLTGIVRSELTRSQDCISQLESRIKYLEGHHCGCLLNPSIPIHSPPASSNGSDEDSAGDTEPIPTSNSRSPRRSNESTIQFVHCGPPEARKAVQCPVTRRWKQEADKLLDGIPEAKAWVEKWKKHGLSSEHDIRSAVGDVLGTPQMSDPRSDAMNSASTVLDSHGRNIRKNLLAHVSNHAETVKHSVAAARMATHIAAFQELVFVSLCVILQQQGTDTSVVDDIMRVCITDSSPKHLGRLRRAVNRVINELQQGGWGQRASEIFILLGSGVAQYTRFADIPDQSRSYFTQRLMKDKYTDGFVAEPGYLSFSIPVIVKRLTGDLLEESAISESLGYSVIPQLAPRGLIGAGEVVPDAATSSKRPRRSTATVNTESEASTRSNNGGYDGSAQRSTHTAQHVGGSGVGFHEPNTHMRFQHPAPSYVPIDVHSDTWTESAESSNVMNQQLQLPVDLAYVASDGNVNSAEHSLGNSNVDSNGTLVNLAVHSLDNSYIDSNGTLVNLAEHSLGNFYIDSNGALVLAEHSLSNSYINFDGTLVGPGEHCSDLSPSRRDRLIVTTYIDRIVRNGKPQMHMNMTVFSKEIQLVRLLGRGKTWPGAFCLDMANLSQADRTVITQHPLDSSLDQLSDTLQNAEQAYKAGSISSNEAVDGSDQGPQKAISRLLSTLMGREVAFNLRSKTGNENIASELSTLFRRVQNRNFNYEHYRAVSRLVIQKAADIDIWDAVFDLITTVSRTTPPTSIPVSFEGTPITHSSASQQGSEQTRRAVEERIFEEIKGCTFRNVEGFFSKYFEGKDWTEQTKEIYRAVQHRHVDGRWTDFPHPPVQNALLKWWFDYQKEFLSDARGVYYTSESSKDLTGAEARRQLDVFVKPNGETFSKTIHDWKDVQVIGELRESDKDWKFKLLQLGRYMRDVFATQPTRRFVHGFTLLGSTMELWVFDRSGPYSSGLFDIHKEPEQFIRAIAGYAMMSDEELGLDTFVERDGEDRFITITEDVTGKEKRLHLERDPIVIQRAIVCRGTNCYRTKDSEHVVKFSWTSDKRPPEADHLRLARERGVNGVAKLLGYHRITSINEMREGLTFPAPYYFRNTSSSASASFSQAPSQSLARSFGPFRGLSIAESASGKRKSDEDDDGPKPSKRSRSNSQRSTLPQEHEVSQTPENAQRKRKSVDHKARASRRSRSNSQRSPLREERKAPQPLGNTQAVSLYAPCDGPFDNRLLGCLVISPAGQAISKFDSISELLTALRDAIKAHRSLYIQGKSLHRDISENNIIITDPKKADGLTGMLIDLELAKEVGSGPSGARHQTGTMEFMAIEVLRRVSHTYRHDLESFFYVLLWICARRAWEREYRCRVVDGPKESMLSKWYAGSYKEIARNKEYTMGVNGFKELLEEFPPVFDRVRPLCKEIRGILFPLLEDGALYTGTPSDPPEKLYDPIIEAFDNAIADMPKEEPEYVGLIP
ncbi:MAG: hypothetical protein Q9217_005981 [Psora testacea]